MTSLYIEMPHTLAFRVKSEVSMLALTRALDAIWSAQWDRISDQEKEGWVRHSRMKFHLGGQATFLIRHYQTKKERWGMRIEHKSGSDQFVIRSSSKSDLKKVWDEMTKNGRNNLYPADIMGTPVFTSEHVAKKSA